ncbi:MAG: hypothetical protein FWC89_06860 [Defluviitaleaceae bacterium]|nr:hypothetical protein [Defluviitaleaceae bacterium]
MKWVEDESILRMFLRRIDDRRSPISNEIAIQRGGTNENHFHCGRQRHEPNGGKVGLEWEV